MDTIKQTWADLKARYQQLLTDYGYGALDAQALWDAAMGEAIARDNRGPVAALLAEGLQNATPDRLASIMEE